MAARSTKSSKSLSRHAKTWKDIDQSVKPKSMSKAVEKKLWLARGRRTLIALFVLAVLFGGLQLFKLTEKGPELLTRAGESLPIKQVSIETDGALDQRWVLEQIEIEENANLLSIDLDALRQKLESIGQVKSVEVERRFPDALAIRIYEREPILRILAYNKKKEKISLVADREGYIFECDFIDPRLENSLPYLFGISIKRDGETYANITGIDPVARLLDEARTIAPHLYRTWRVVSMESVPTEIIVTGEKFKKAIFKVEPDFRNSLAKLDYILDYTRDNYANPIGLIDLTLGNQVPVSSAPSNR